MFFQDRTKRTTDIVVNLQNVVMSNVVTGEGPVEIQTDHLSLQVEKTAVKEFGRKGNSLKNCNFKAPQVAALGLQESRFTFGFSLHKNMSWST